MHLSIYVNLHKQFIEPTNHYPNISFKHIYVVKTAKKIPETLRESGIF